MSNPLVISLPGIPQGKGRARFARATGRAYTPAKTVSYEGALKLAAGEVMSERLPMEGPVAVLILARVPIPKMPKARHALAVAGRISPLTRPDADNYAKVMDALNAIVWKDDRQVVDLRVRKEFSERPELRIEVLQLAEVR